MRNNVSAWEVIFVLLVGILMTGWFGPIGLLITCIAVMCKWKKGDGN